MGRIRIPKIGRKIEDDQSILYFKNRTRFAILVLATLCLSISQSNALTLNFTIICMNNGSSAQQEEVFTPSEKSYLFSSVAIGAMVAVHPCMLLIQKFGSRAIFTFFGFFSAFCTAVLPLSMDFGFKYVVMLRFLQGTGLSPVFTLIAIVTTQWSMLKQNSFYIAVLTCFFQIGPIFTMPVAGALCSSSYGWQSVYYVHSLTTVILYLLFLYFYREQPERHRMVSEKELLRIKRSKAQVLDREPVPYRKIITSPAIIACWVTAVGNFLGIQTTMQFTPIFLNKVLSFPVDQTGLFSAIPQIVTFVVKILAGIMADKMKCCSIETSVKLFNTIAVAGMGIAFIVQAYIPIDCPILSLLCLIFATSIIGFNCGAFFRSSAVVAAQHNHFVMTVNSFLNCVCALLSPVIVNILVTNNTWDEWWYVWMLHGSFMLVTNTAFVIFGKGEPAAWTEPPVLEEKNTLDGNEQEADMLLCEEKL
ncbi:unnamed protein product [Auanema sp. JU1783]|nr:unnamed protein product [Auanema sp. JU1783]